MLTVPEPLPNDPESVVTALETAEIFGKQGDVKEAVRWVRRAAEIAGDEGNDERALTLARAVADLNTSASQPPKPPSAAPVPTSDDPEGDAETRVVDSAKMLADYERQRSGGNGAAAPVAAAPEPPPPPPLPPPPSATAADTAPEPPPPPPPPPSAATVDTVPGFGQAAVTAALAAEVATEPARDAEESTPVSRRGISSMAELLARKEAEVSSARAAADAAQPADTGWDDPPPPPPEPPAETQTSVPPQASTPPVERRTARPSGDRIPTPVVAAQPYTERPPVNAAIHQAVRASVVATAEPGVFVLRVLAADQSPAPTAHEVLVVVTSPLSSPFK